MSIAFFPIGAKQAQDYLNSYTMDKVVKGMERNKILYYLGNLICRIADIQLSKFITLLIKAIVTLIGILAISLVFFHAINQSIVEGAFQGFFNTSGLGSVMIKYSSTELYHILLDITFPLLILFSFIIGPISITIFRILTPCEDFNPHEAYEIYNQEKTLKRLTDNLVYEKYKPRYGSNRMDYDDIKDTYYLEAFQVNHRLFSKENVFLRVYVYPNVHFHRDSEQMKQQLEDSFSTGKELFTKHDKARKNYIIPIFITENSDLKTKEFIVKQFHKQKNIRQLPLLYCGAENWWFHKRTKRPFIVSILKTLERSEKQISNEEFERSYQEANYFLKGNGYTDYKQGNEYLEKGKYKQALKHFMKALKGAQSDRDKSHAYSLIGLCHNELNAKEECINALTSATRINTKNYDAWEYLGMVYFHYKDYENALSCFERCVTAYPDHVNFAYLYAYTHMQLKQYHRAIAVLTRILQTAPTDWKLLSRLSLAYASIGDRRNAEHYVQRVTQLGVVASDFLIEEVEKLLDTFENKSN